MPLAVGLLVIVTPLPITVNIPFLTVLLDIKFVVIVMVSFANSSAKSMVSPLCMLSNSYPKEPDTVRFPSVFVTHRIFLFG
ncbi:hypothetical protein Barb4_04096 [Bacteroidales bacterium Barb4]|nr:hypothetical protein Barb4_04096 [Bacteroidales bacterium Barb4]